MVTIHGIRLLTFTEESGILGDHDIAGAVASGDRGGGRVAAPEARRGPVLCAPAPAGRLSASFGKVSVAGHYQP